MIELIVVMILVGIMAAVVIPRFDTLTSFDARGYGDQIESWLRFAQKSALAKRRPVCVTLSAATDVAPVVRVGATNLSTCVQSCDSTISTTLISPPGAFREAQGASLTGAGNFCFDTLGRPSASQSLTLKDNTGAVIRTVTVEDETGYVH